MNNENLADFRETANQVLKMTNLIQEVPKEWLLEELVRREIESPNYLSGRIPNGFLGPGEQRTLSNNSESYMLLITCKFVNGVGAFK